MGALRHVITLFVMANTVQLSWGLCQTHPVNNGLEDCEMRYNIQRHELVGMIRTQSQADGVCRDYPAYENCITELVKDCSEERSFLDALGYDQKSAIISFKGFCADREVYLKDVSCYNVSHGALWDCFNDHGTGREAAAQRVNITGDWDQFYDDFCPFQVDGAKCVTDAVATCPDDVKKVMSNIAYALMHSRCKAEKYGTVKSEYDSLYGSGPAMTSFGVMALCVVAIITRLF